MPKYAFACEHFAIGRTVGWPIGENPITYAQNRACFRSGEIRILDSDGAVERVIPFDDTNRKL